MTSLTGDPGVLALGLAIAGIVSGLAAGMLGTGGSIVIVPILYHVLATLGVEEGVRMHIAVGTSLAAIIPSCISTVALQDRNGSLDWILVKQWATPMLAGVLVAAALAAFASGRMLSLIFAAVALAVALHLAFGRQNLRLAARPPQSPAGFAMPALVGGVSTMTGVDGTSIVLPVLALFGIPIPRAAAAAAAFGAIIAIPGTIGAVIAGWHASGLPPYSFGYVNLVGFLLIAPSTFLARFGAQIADQVDTKRMRTVFAIFIAIVTARMLFDALA
jgi:uncharacterized membrane protein YfcA